MRNTIFTTLSQQILTDRLLLVVTDGQKNNFNSGFKLKLITIDLLGSVMNIL